MPNEKALKARIRDLDTMPQVFRKLMSVLDSPYPSSRELGRVIATDQGLSVRVLRMANSAATGTCTPIQSVPQAVSLLGLNVVRSLSLCMASYDSFFAARDPERQQLWRHSLLCAVFCRDLSAILRMGQPEELFVAGMLHDVGHSLLIKHWPLEYRKLSSALRSGEYGDPLEAERVLLGNTHDEVGGWACEAWKLSPELYHCVRFHHQPAEADPEYRRLVSIVHAAEYQALRTLEPELRELPQVQLDILRGLGLCEEQLEPLLAESLVGFAEMESFLRGENFSTLAS